MEIHLLLEGEQVGPLTAEQVRKYLGEGLITGEDLASLEGVDDWHPLDVVLAHFPPHEPATQEPIPPSAFASDGNEEEEVSFLVPSAANPSFETGPVPPIESAMTATQRTKRKLSRIVIQPILPLEAKLLPARRKTGRTVVTLEPIRPTTALPPVNGHRPKQKSAGRGKTGKVAIQVALETAPLPPPPPVESFTIESAVEPIDASAEPIATAPPLDVPGQPAMAAEAPDEAAAPLDLFTVSETFSSEAAPLEPVPASRASIPVAEKAAPAASAGIPITPKPLPERLKLLRESSPPEKPPEPKSSDDRGPYSAPQFSVLPRGGTFMPPSVRNVGGSRHHVPTKFPVAGVALGLFIFLVIVVCLFLLVVHGGSPSRIPDRFAPRAAVIVPNTISTPGTAPPTAAQLSDLGMKSQAAGDLDEAIHDYDQALAIDPKAVEVFYQRGLARQAKRDMAGAVADYTQVIALDPRRGSAYSNRGYIRQAANDFDAALTDYAQALALNPKLPVVCNNVGLIKVRKGDIDGAITAYDRAVELDPHMAFAWYNRGVARNTEGDVVGAVADFSQAIAVNPKIAVAYCNRGIALESKGDANRALDDFSQAIALDPSLTDAFLHRGRIRLTNGDLKGAEDDSTHAIARDVGNAAAYNQRGLALMGHGRTEAALADFKKFCGLVPKDAAADEARLYMWVLATEFNANGDADAELSTALQNAWNSTPEDLTSKIAAFLLGHINESDLIADAASPDPAREPGQYCRVWYFTGMKRLMAGDTMTAAGYFQKCTATGRKDFAEYAFALAQLQAMNAGPEIGSRN